MTATAVTAVTVTEAWVHALGVQARDGYLLAMRLQHEGRLAAASSLLVRASCVEPDSAELREVAARAQFRAGQYIGAYATFSAMRALASQDDFALYASAVCAACLGRLDEAVTDLTDAVGRRPDVDTYIRAFDVVRQLVDELAGSEPVQMPTYADPPIRLDHRLLDLELGPRPPVPDGQP